MKNLLFLSFFIFLATFESKAQEVIASGGDYFENSSVSISWTLGEPVTETITDGTNILTQGFQQSKLTTTEIFNINTEKFDINLFPNPTLNIINIQTSDFENLTYNISDTNGKLLKEGKLISENTEIFVNKLPAAVYFFTIFENKKIITIFQIVKQ